MPKRKHTNTKKGSSAARKGTTSQSNKTPRGKKISQIMKNTGVTRKAAAKLLKDLRARKKQVGKKVHEDRYALKKTVGSKKGSKYAKKHGTPPETRILEGRIKDLMRKGKSRQEAERILREIEFKKEKARTRERNRKPYWLR